MGARVIGSATISFGLVSVPVKLFSSSESAASISFNLLHKECGSRLKQQYICPADGATVPRDEMVKGYEFAKGKYVQFTPEELKTLDETATNSIDIAEFVPLDSVERSYVNKTFYLGPDKGGERAYRLLAEALRDTGRAALGQYAARGNQYLALIRPLEHLLVMEQLHYADELRPPNEVPVGDTPVKPAELELARQLIQQTATEEFHPERFRDQVRERVMAAIQRKVDGEEITTQPTEEASGARILDLMEALRASLGQSPSSPDDTTEQRKTG
jgi:DNA end-binding protein Ku